MAPKKGKEVEQALLEPVVEDPATIAARAERERLMAEDRKSFERQELIDRRRIESLEQVGLRIIQMEREKRLDPAAWAAKVGGSSQPKVAQILVKPLVGNRATVQQLLTVRFTPSETNLLMLKCKIRDEAAGLGLHPALFAPERQKLFLWNKEVVSGDDQHTMVSAVGIHHGATVHVALAMPASQWELLAPSKLSK